MTTPKEAALRDYQDGDLNPVAPMNYTHEQKAAYYKEFLALVNNENIRTEEELRANV